MSKNVLLISSESKFMVAAIKKNLLAEEYTVIDCAPTIKDLNLLYEGADVYLFYLENNVDEMLDFLVYLKDIIMEKEKFLCLIGDETEFETVARTIPDASVALKMLRPLDVKALIGELDKVFEKREESTRKKSILLVDDDVAFLKIMHDWLSVSYRVTVVSSGMQAITYLANNTPDLILLDYEMPVTSGPQVLSMIRSELKTAETPVIFLTGKSDKESVTSVLNLKPNGYLLKTMPKEKIMDSVAKFFEEEKVKRILKS